MKKKQKIQENQYRFPYHHLPKEGNGFSQARNLRWGYEYLSYLQYITKWLEKHSFQTLIDVGCGDGKFLFEVGAIFKDKHLEGVDYSKQAVKFARAFNPDISFHIGDITSTQTDKETYGVITLIEVLEHIPPQDINNFLKAIRRQLENDGVFIVTVPTDNLPTAEKHYQHFNKESLESVLSPLFEISEWHFLNKIGLLDKLIRVLLSNRLFILNQHRLLNTLYSFYKKHLLGASSYNAKRIMAICQKK